MKKKYEIDMCNGPLWGKLILFAVPLIISGVLQLLFTAVDVVVVGRFSGSHALAAVGATSSIINLFVNFFMGFSVGVNVVVGIFCGAKDEYKVSRTVHTAIAFSFICGFCLTVIGVLFTDSLLRLMGTPPEVLDHAVIYMKIIFLGMIAQMLYNFGAAILRAIGDTQRPLYYLLVAGVINVALNLFFVIALNMGIAGVALGTIISQAVSAGLVLRCLMNLDGMYKFEWKKMKISLDMLKRIIRIGLPAGLQGAIFSISNVLIQSSVNSFGAAVVAGSTAAHNVEGFVYTGMNGIYQTTLSFTSQNMGVYNYKRIDEIMKKCLILTVLIGSTLGILVVTFGEQILGIYSSDPVVIQYGMQRLFLVSLPYFICGMMDVFVGSLRGMGYSVLPMLVSLTGACFLRIVWIYTIFQWHRSFFVLLLSYSVTWSITTIAHCICWFWARKQNKKKQSV